MPDYYIENHVLRQEGKSSTPSNSCAKGKTVKVRVKAYYYDANGTK